MGIALTRLHIDREIYRAVSLTLARYTVSRPVSQATLPEPTSSFDPVGDPVVLGPDSVGQFTPTTIKSIQRKRVDVESAEAGQSVSLVEEAMSNHSILTGLQ